MKLCSRATVRTYYVYSSYHTLYLYNIYKHDLAYIFQGWRRDTLVGTQAWVFTAFFYNFPYFGHIHRKIRNTKSVSEWRVHTTHSHITKLTEVMKKGIVSLEKNQNKNAVHRDSACIPIPSHYLNICKREEWEIFTDKYRER